VERRMANRGSGMWFFSCRNGVAQHNTILHAYGEGDSYGIHTDYNNKFILVQYNYTQGIHGGFVEVLGKNTFVTYRYNISVNDSRREKMGNTFWFSDFAGADNIPSTNIHVYNNSVYINKDAQGDALTPGINLIEAGSAVLCNNIIHVAGNRMSAPITVRRLIRRRRAASLPRSRLPIKVSWSTIPVPGLI
jgi:hypothetical protein